MVGIGLGLLFSEAYHKLNSTFATVNGEVLLVAFLFIGLGSNLAHKDRRNGAAAPRTPGD